MWAFLVPSTATLSTINKNFPSNKTTEAVLTRGGTPATALLTQVSQNSEYRESLKVPIYPWENKSIPSAYVKSNNEPYRVVTAIRTHALKTNESDYEYIQLPPTIDDCALPFIIRNSINSNIQPKAYEEDLIIEITVPAYWERDTTIYVEVKFTKPPTYWPPTTPVHYTDDIVINVKDKYFVPGYGWLWTNEEKAPAQLHVDFTLVNPWETRSFRIPVEIGHTTIGLKKVVVTFINHAMIVDEGYIFVQKINSDEIGNLNYLTSYYLFAENPLGETDLHHPMKWYKMAGEATDSLYMTNDDFKTITDRLGNWVTNNFVYDKDSLSLSYTASDTWLINHRDDDGKFHGVYDEYAVIFVSFARALNLPARQIRIEGTNSSNKRDAHEFPEVWNRNTWIHIEIAGAYLYNPDTPNIFRQMGFKSIDLVQALIYVTDDDGDGLVTYYSEIWGDYYGPNGYTFQDK